MPQIVLWFGQPPTFYTRKCWCKKCPKTFGYLQWSTAYIFYQTFRADEWLRRFLKKSSVKFLECILSSLYHTCFTDLNFAILTKITSSHPYTKRFFKVFAGTWNFHNNRQGGFSLVVTMSVCFMYVVCCHLCIQFVVKVFFRNTVSLLPPNTLPSPHSGPAGPI